MFVAIFFKISWSQYSRKAMIIILSIYTIHEVYLNHYCFYSLVSINASEWMKNEIFLFYLLTFIWINFLHVQSFHEFQSLDKINVYKSDDAHVAIVFRQIFIDQIIFSKRFILNENSLNEFHILNSIIKT
jgi:hypothetical protein